MTTKEKAKAYDEALEKAKKYHQRLLNEDNQEWASEIEELFPELKESEDERTRKAIIDYLASMWRNKQYDVCGVHVVDAMAWLEKQSEQKTIDSLTPQEAMDIAVAKCFDEQKPVDKAEPKFHEGERITNGDYTWKIVEVKPLDYILQSQDGNIVDDAISHVDEQFHSFTIEDAKDGDVLVNGNEIVIFKENNFNEKDLSGCMFVHCKLRDKKGSWRTIGGINPTDYTPATKEQRDLLFQKMKEAGYEWDSEKKELKKIEQKSAEWNEEDSYYRNHIIQIIEEIKNAPLKRREDWDSYINWLKSLKPQNRWKPSDEQIGVVEAVINNKSFQRRHLNSLYEQLKKLKGE